MVREWSAGNGYDIELTKCTFGYVVREWCMGNGYDVWLMVWCYGSS